MPGDTQVGNVWEGQPTNDFELLKPEESELGALRMAWVRVCSNSVTKQLTGLRAAAVLIPYEPSDSQKSKEDANTQDNSIGDTESSVNGDASLDDGAARLL